MSRCKRSFMTISQDGEEQPRSTQDQKIIIRFCSGEIMKGYVQLNPNVDPAALFDHYEGSAHRTISIRPVGSRTTVGVPWDGIKSVFLVRSFRGDPRRKDLRFYA